MHTGMNDFKKGYQPRTNILKDEQGDLLADPPQYYGQAMETFISATECTWG